MSRKILIARSSMPGHWREEDGAPFTITDARRAYDAGKIEMVQARDPDDPAVMRLFVIRRRQPARDRHPWFFPRRDGLQPHHPHRHKQAEAAHG